METIENCLKWLKLKGWRFCGGNERPDGTIHLSFTKNEFPFDEFGQGKGFLGALQNCIEKIQQKEAKE